MVGPLVVAAVLATRGDYRLAFSVLAVPAAINLCFLAVARLVFPRPKDMERRTASEAGAGSFPTLYWVYLGGAELVAAGFADYPLPAVRQAAGQKSAPRRRRVKNEASTRFRGEKTQIDATRAPAAAQSVAQAPPVDAWVSAHTAGYHGKGSSSTIVASAPSTAAAIAHHAVFRFSIAACSFSLKFANVQP